MEKTKCTECKGSTVATWPLTDMGVVHVPRSTREPILLRFIWGVHRASSWSTGFSPGQITPKVVQFLLQTGLGRVERAVGRTNRNKNKLIKTHNSSCRSSNTNNQWNRWKSCWQCYWTKFSISIVCNLRTRSLETINLSITEFNWRISLRLDSNLVSFMLRNHLVNHFCC